MEQSFKRLGTLQIVAASSSSEKDFDFLDRKLESPQPEAE